MNYEQVKLFYPKEMGTQKGWCLKNCRLGFRIYSGKYANAKSAMQAGKRYGTFHQGTPPTNISVPVYTVSSSSNGHVVVCDKGTYYTDGKKYKPATKDIYGWDENMDGVRVVKKASAVSFLPAKGYWKRGDKDPRIGKLCEFYYTNFYGYFCKNMAQAKKLLAGNEFGKNCEKWTREFQRRTGLYPDGMVGKLTYAKLKTKGFKG